MRNLIYIERLFNRFGDLLGWLSSVLFILLLANVVYDVVMRYVFNDVSIAFQEMEWHLFSAVFLLGIPFALKSGGHVRVDLFYERLSHRAQAIIDLLGTIFFLFPFCLLVAWFGIDFAKESYALGETSGDPGGLPYRWVIKAIIPLSFLFMAISGVGLLLHSLNKIVNPHLMHQSPSDKS
ncbi:TRAP transporter small permease subunit [Vibrio vulnificus]|jgi:TRAP-type mannitol/chloroaromatic compound transport system permease small subunit|uniref:TRAP transporter small permease protein n=2 Tax=Vibrio vulnificus TaxID=672 RepID=Q7MJQ2_VIBVY|nr:MULTISPECIES: TRAP transporter small permease subunit [Vibrio]EWS70547.1 C4-dicarboxylate ABC transporter permease [Vibrio vulnificus BAA87]OJI56980.1 2,3-diketo-L-gulonate TRAP transporter small permease protein YiaM [Vibrio fluvialis]AAO10617.1 TRAP dicarboxylate transporter, DctQ subunit, unknown substrate 6 [Vibrio vulnificus CMCP6]ADV86133.1 TRAP dicarboxylate transporter, DctQ subunit, unknown substrate 6 [Vibrio vulnificus MO6-24/O]AIL70953.1 C4-dicarboxylate ABC transporter [Vibrio 